MTCGIYCIRNTYDTQVYVGSSVCIEERWVNHQRRLRRGNHHARKLQEAWNRLGPDRFYLVVLEELPQKNDTLVQAEQRWINRLNAFCGGFNTRPRAESCLGLKRPAFSEEHRRRIAEAKTGEKNPNYGKARPESTRRKIAESNTGVQRTEETKQRVSASRIRRGEPGFEQFAAKIGATASETRRLRGLERLQRDLKAVQEVLRLLGPEPTPARWNWILIQRGLPLTRAGRRVQQRDYVIYGVPWAEFLEHVRSQLDDTLELPDALDGGPVHDRAACWKNAWPRGPHPDGP